MNYDIATQLTEAMEAAQLALLKRIAATAGEMSGAQAAQAYRDLVESETSAIAVSKASG